MDPVQLRHPDGTPADAWACGKCRKVLAAIATQDDWPRQQAKRCCEPPRCPDCEAAVSGYFDHRCGVCRAKREAAAEAERFAKATKITPTDYPPDRPVFFVNGKYRPLGEIDLEYDPPGDYVWATREVKFEPCVDGMIENALDDHHEDARQEITDEEMTELTDFVAKWAEGTGVRSYEVDYTRAIVLTPATTDPTE